MGTSRRDLAALVVAIAAFGAAATAATLGQSGSGVRLDIADGHVVLAEVDPWSTAAAGGLTPGMVVVYVNELDVFDASASVQASVVGALAPDQSITAIPATLVQAEAAGRERAARATPTTGPDGELIPVEMGPFVPASYGGGFWSGISRTSSLATFGLALLILVGGWWWLTSGGGGTALRRYAVTLPVAVALPLVSSIDLALYAAPAALAGIWLTAAAAVPLGLQFAGDAPERRRVLERAAVGFAIAAVVVVVAPLSIPAEVRLLWACCLVALTVLLPGIAAARPLLGETVDDPRGSAPAPSRLVESAELALAALTPVVALVTLAFRGSVPFLLPIVIWLGAILAARRFTLRPLARLAARATLQRDVVVAATEAERARIAADIHDDALQDLTLLIRRLDAAGAGEDADAAREIAARLRAICGELRLPILDDLGLGPALEWLVERFEQMAGPVYLERARDERRLPQGVELAFFRVTQEALTNAVKHGRPPIVVRYRSGETWAELDVDDSGPGLPAQAAQAAERAGHFGLLNMAQRAEQVGASLRFGHRPGGGTRVSLVWEREAARPEAIAATRTATGAATGAAAGAAPASAAAPLSPGPLSPAPEHLPEPSS